MSALTAADRVWRAPVEVKPIFARAKAARAEETSDLESRLDEQYQRIADDGRLIVHGMALRDIHVEVARS